MCLYNSMVGIQPRTDICWRNSWGFLVFPFHIPSFPTTCSTGEFIVCILVCLFVCLERHMHHKSECLWWIPDSQVYFGSGLLSLQWTLDLEGLLFTHKGVKMPHEIFWKVIMKLKNPNKQSTVILSSMQLLQSVTITIRMNPIWPFSELQVDCNDCWLFVPLKGRDSLWET